MENIYFELFTVHVPNDTYTYTRTQRRVRPMIHCKCARNCRARAVLPPRTHSSSWFAFRTSRSHWPQCWAKWCWLLAPTERDKDRKDKKFTFVLIPSPLHIGNQSKLPFLCSLSFLCPPTNCDYVSVSLGRLAACCLPIHSRRSVRPHLSPSARLVLCDNEIVSWF